MKAEDNPFPYITLVEQASAPATPASGKAKIYRGTDNKNYMLDDGGASTEFPAAGGGGSSLGQIIAYNSYNPGTLANYSTSSTTAVDLDATNMAVTFTAPSSGKVLVRLTAQATTNNTAAQYWWGLRESTTLIAIGVATYGNIQGVRTQEFVLTGLSAGSHTYKWAHFVSNAAHSGVCYVGGPMSTSGVGAATMTVTSLT